MATHTIVIEDELMTTDVINFADVVEECTKLYAKKNHDYGNSFDKGMSQIGPAYGIGRIFDKTNRLVNLFNKEQEVNDESIEDTLKDLACYSIMMIVNLRKQLLDKQSKITYE